MARKQAWYRAVSLSKHRRDLIMWLLQWVLNTTIRFSTEGSLFAFLPEFYINVTPLLLDTILDFSFHDVQEQYELSDVRDILKQVAAFYSIQLTDTHIVLAACKDAVIQTLGLLACHKDGIEAFEAIDEEVQIRLVSALLRPYENRAWGQSNWLLLRFWLGHGFATKELRPANPWNNGDVSCVLGLKRRRTKSNSYTGLLHLVAPSCPSRKYQQYVARILLEDPEYTLKFLNSLLGQLNWAFSEFVHILQEIQSILVNKDNTSVTIDLKQLKICAMCFDLTTSLLRALEMIITLLPDLFQDFLPGNSAENLLNRICQLIVQILTRTTIPISCFQIILDANLPELHHVTHFAILSVTVGILLALMQNEMGREDVMVKMPKVSRMLLTDPGFHIACLEFTLGHSGMPPSLQNIPRGNFDPNLGRTDMINSTQSLLASAVVNEQSFNDESIESESQNSRKTLADHVVRFDFRKCKLQNI